MHQQQALFPGSQPDAPVMGLQHPQSVVVLAIGQFYWLKPVVQTVQPLYERLSPVGGGPYLIGVVDEHLSRTVVALVQLVLLGLSRLDDIAPYPIPHRCCPEVTLLVDSQTGHHRVNIHRQLLELLHRLRQAEHAFLCTHIDGILCRKQGRHILADAELGYAVRLHLCAVIATETVISTQPDETVGILHDVAHRVRQ